MARACFQGLPPLLALYALGWSRGDTRRMEIAAAMMRGDESGSPPTRAELVRLGGVSPSTARRWARAWRLHTRLLATSGIPREVLVSREVFRKWPVRKWPGGERPASERPDGEKPDDERPDGGAAWPNDQE